MYAAEIRRLADDGAVGWQTTEESINGEIVCYCGSALSLFLHPKRWEVFQMAKCGGKGKGSGKGKGK